MRNGYMTVSQELEVDVDINVDDVCEFIDDHATKSDLEVIRTYLNHDSGFNTKTMFDTMKIELLKKAFKNMTLEELELKLEMSYI